MTTDVQVRDETASLNGLLIHYRDWGDATAPPLVLLHGLTGQAHFWDAFAATMAGRMRVLAPDARGHGQSDQPGDYHPDRMVADLAAFVDHFGLDRCALLGHSMGALISYLFAARFPDRVSRLVIVDFAPDVASAPDMEMVWAMVKAAPDLAFSDPEEVVRLARSRNPRPPEEMHRRTILANLVQRADGQWVYRYDAARLPTFLANLPPEVEQWELLPRITCPTLLVRGAESGTLRSATAARMAQTIPDCRLVAVPNSAHVVPLDNPEAFVSVVQPFLLATV